tara:strand:+ start:80 stop:280 length:201 start_codon:yes stop_codon:yes gene_type:complete
MAKKGEKIPRARKKIPRARKKKVHILDFHYFIVFVKNSIFLTTTKKSIKYKKVYSFFSYKYYILYI